MADPALQFMRRPVIREGHEHCEAVIASLERQVEFLREEMHILLRMLPDPAQHDRDTTAYTID